MVHLRLLFTILIIIGLSLLFSSGVLAVEKGRKALSSEGLGHQTAKPFVSAQPDSDRETNRALQIQWYEWDTVAFDRARNEDKLILLDLTSKWCHACHEMERTTYRNPEVIRLLNTHFIPIRVDSDVRPDLELRYRHGGWPTTAVILQTGEILYQANFLDVEDMITVLEDTRNSYREQKSELKARAAEVWKSIARALDEKTLPTASLEKSVLDRTVTTMYQSFDPIHGGFRRAPKFFEPDAIRFGFLHYHRTGDVSIKHMILKTLDAQLKLFDTEWGGFFRYAEQADWTGPHYEKMLQVQADNLLNYLEAFQMTGASQYQEVAEGILSYVDRFLTNPEKTGFYSSQNSEVGTIPGKDYFTLTDRERRQQGLPTVDKAIYTHSNARMVLGYLRAAQVLGKPEYQRQGLTVLSSLYQERFRAGRGLAHVVTGGVPRLYGLLASQVSMGRAFLEAYSQTAETRYLDQAKKIVDTFLLQLEDAKGGGFYDHPRERGEEGLLKFSQKPVKQNVEAALLLIDLFYVTHLPHYLEKGKQALQLVLHSGEALPVALLGMAVDKVMNFPLHVVIVGKKTDSNTWRLFQEAVGLYIPNKVVRVLDPSQDSLTIGDVSFPRREYPQAFVCTDKFCSKPVGPGQSLRQEADQVITVTAKSWVTGGES